MIVKMKYVLLVLCFATIVSLMKNIKMFHISTKKQDIVPTLMTQVVTTTKINKKINDILVPLFTQSQIDACSPVVYFVFIKTHKTGSTTVENALTRFQKRLNIMENQMAPVPFIGGYPGYFKRKFFLQSNKPIFNHFENKSGSFAITAHSRFNSTEVRWIMPSNAKYFSIMRKPWDEYQSAYNYYYKTNKVFFRKLKSNCEVFPYLQIAKGESLNVFQYLNVSRMDLNKTVPWYFRSKNYQAYDLGVDSFLESDEKIQEVIAKLVSEIDLVMITEYMEESMILLKELLCMQWEDFIIEDSRVNSHYERIQLESYPEMEKQFNEFYKLDITLYKHFNATLWEKVDQYGREKMERDVLMLRKIRATAQRDEPPERDTRMIPRIPRSSNFKTYFKHRISRHYSTEVLVDKLKRKLKRESRFLSKTPRFVHELASYMVDYGGGCPL